MKYNFKEVLSGLESWKKKSQKWDDAFIKLFKVIAPSCYAPIIEDDCLAAFINGVSLHNKELEQDLLDYIYEPTLVITTISDNKEYNIKNKKEAIAYFNKTYNS